MVESLEAQGGLANPTLDKMRRVMSLVYGHSQCYGLIPRNQESDPMPLRPLQDYQSTKR